MKQSKNLTHFNTDGEAHLVDVSSKDTTARTAIAIGSISMAKVSLDIIKTGVTKKGDVLSEGVISPHDILETQGVEKSQLYLSNISNLSYGR